MRTSQKTKQESKIENMREKLVNFFFNLQVYVLKTGAVKEDKRKSGLKKKSPVWWEPPRTEVYAFPEWKDATVPNTMVTNTPSRGNNEIRTRDKEGSLSGREKGKKKE